MTSKKFEQNGCPVFQVNPKVIRSKVPVPQSNLCAQAVHLSPFRELRQVDHSAVRLVEFLRNRLSKPPIR